MFHSTHKRPFGRQEGRLGTEQRGTALGIVACGLGYLNDNWHRYQPTETDGERNLYP